MSSKASIARFVGGAAFIVDISVYNSRPGVQKASLGTSSNALGPEGVDQLNRWYAFACVFLAFLASAARVPAVADADPFAHADWDAILRNDGGLNVVKLGDAVSARYTCIDAPDVASGCYTGGGSSGKVHGTWLAVIPIDGMGTGGIMTIILYVWRDNAPHRLTTLGVYKCVARIEKGRLVVKQPVYAAREGNCCAKHNSIMTYTVAGGKLVKISSITLPGNL